jgi:cell wall-associated NlpC family hydrolase
LVQLAHRCAGIEVPRYAHGQWLRCRPIDPKNLQPGDLLFLGTMRDGALVMVHVMLYAGQGVLIEANGFVGAVQVVSIVDRLGKPLSELQNGEEIRSKRVLFCGSFFEK